MTRFEVLVEIRSSIDEVFDLARNIDLHVDSLSHTRERAVAGVTSGLIGADDEVTWEAVHFGVRQRLTSRVTCFDQPNHFRDEMTRGAFRSFVHDHYFRSLRGVVEMKDVVAFQSPLGLVGRIVDAVILERYLRKLIATRADHIKRIAEGAEQLVRGTVSD